MKHSLRRQTLHVVFRDAKVVREPTCPAGTRRAQKYLQSKLGSPLGTHPQVACLQIALHLTLI